MNFNETFNERLTNSTDSGSKVASKKWSIPINVFIQEAENLYNWCQADKEKLIANGLDWSIVEDMPSRINKLREAEAVWLSTRFSHVKARKVWLEKAPYARAFQAELLRTIKFACRENNNALIRIKRLGICKKNSEMIQSLKNLAIIGREHSEDLLKIKYDLSKLDIASGLSEELGTVLAAATTEKTASCKLTAERDLACEILKEAVDITRKYGKFVFRKSDPRAKGYSSTFSKSRNSKYKKKD